MSPTPANTTDSSVNRQQAAKFVADVIISRRHILSYPPTHPVVAAALQKTVASLEPLIAGGRTFTMGVSRQGMLLQNETLSPELRKFREFADILSSMGIIAISFTEDLNPQETPFLLLHYQQAAQRDLGRRRDQECLYDRRDQWHKNTGY